MSVATEQMICQGHLWTVVYVHDDSGRGLANGRLPFELDHTFIPERKFGSAEGSSAMVTWMPTTTQVFFVQCWPKRSGAEICKTRSTMGRSKQEHLRIVVCGHDDSGKGITTGHRGGIPVRKFDFAEDSCILHDVVDNLTGLHEVLVQVRWNWDVQGQVRDGNERTGHMEDLDDITLGGSAVAEFVTGALLGPCEELDAETDVVYGLFFVFGLTFWQTPCTKEKTACNRGWQRQFTRTSSLLRLKWALT